MKVQIPPYYMFLIFGYVYEAACLSSNYKFRHRMAQIVNMLYHPLIHTRRQTHYVSLRQRGLTIDNLGRRLGRRYLCVPEMHIIDANLTADLEVELKRIRLLERLRIVRLFCFCGTRDRETYVVIDGQRILQNRHVYDKVVNTIPVDRVFVLDRDKEGLPALPRDHRMLETFVEPPYYKSFITFERLPEGMTFL